MSGPISRQLVQAVFQTLVYSDIFDYPLTAEEVHRYLTGMTASYENVRKVLDEDARFVKTGKYFTLPGRAAIVKLREQRELHSQKRMPYARWYGRILGMLPFVGMVTLTGSLAVMNTSNDADFDYMLVTRPNRLWTARAFVLLFGRLTRLWGHTICPNLIVTENFLEWHQQDLYSAREFCQMMPITGSDVYQVLIKKNIWIKGYLPNAYQELGNSRSKRKHSLLQTILEMILRGGLGNRFEQWEMQRKVARFSKQAGFGEETQFSAEICQGNFDHHKRWVQQMFQTKLLAFEQNERNPLKVPISDLA